jgi:Leucine-rich repeat (LRR) protein
MPSLVYLDLTLNRINDLSSVCEFARNTLDIVHLDLTANPLLSRSQWKVCPAVLGASVNSTTIHDVCIAL